MSNPVEFGLAVSNSYPSGTGSYNYKGQFEIVVQNLAYQKQVSIWGQKYGSWTDIPAQYAESLPDDRELWVAPATNNEDKFVAKYTVQGTTYWDNNDWKDYLFPKAYDEFVVLSGKSYPVVLGSASLTATNLHVDIGVQNLDFVKVVGIVFSTDNWSTVQTAYAQYKWTMKSGIEVWEVIVPMSAGQVDLAVFYRVLGNEFWDNNFWRNYHVTPTTTAQWGVPLP